MNRGGGLTTRDRSGRPGTAPTREGKPGGQAGGQGPSCPSARPPRGRRPGPSPRWVDAARDRAGHVAAVPSSRRPVRPPPFVRLGCRRRRARRGGRLPLGRTAPVGAHRPRRRRGQPARRPGAGGRRCRRGDAAAPGGRLGRRGPRRPAAAGRRRAGDPGLALDRGDHRRRTDAAGRRRGGRPPHARGRRGRPVRHDHRRSAGGVVPLEVASPAEGDPDTAAALAAIEALPPELRGQVSLVTAEDAGSAVALHLDDDTTVVWGDGGEASRKAAVLVALLQQIEAGEIEAAETLDVSAPGAVFSLGPGCRGPLAGAGERWAAGFHGRTLTRPLGIPGTRSRPGCRRGPRSSSWGCSSTSSGARSR